MFATLKNKIDKIESVYLRGAAIIATFTAIGGSLSTIGYYIFQVYLFAVTITNIVNLENEVRANMSMIKNVQAVNLHALKAEMDSKTIFGVEVQQTNGGDYWYFTKEVVYTDKDGNEFTMDVIYSAHVRQKEKKVGYFDFNNNHKWIKDEHIH